jgi:hypothetical protein
MQGRFILAFGKESFTALQVFRLRFFLRLGGLGFDDLFPDCGATDD